MLMLKRYKLNSYKNGWVFYKRVFRVTAVYHERINDRDEDFGNGRFLNYVEFRRYLK